MVNVFEGRSRTPLFDRSYNISYSQSVVTTSLSCTVFQVLPLLQCTWLPVTLRGFDRHINYKPCSPSIRFMCKRIVGMCDISWGTGARKTLRIRGNLQGHSRSLVIPHSCQLQIYTSFTRYNRLSNRLNNRLDNRLNVCLHDAAACSTGCSTGLTTGCIV